MKTVDLWFDPVCPWAWIASRSHGEEGLRDLYTALGTRSHHDKAPASRETILAEPAPVDLPAALDPSGEDLGVPAIHVDGRSAPVTS